jgi:iron(II)-dependent oxidoreductase
MNANNHRAALKRELELSDLRMRELVLTLSDEQREVPYVAGINPPVWEMGHAAFFYEVFLLRELYGSKPQMPGHDEMWDSFEIPHKERWREGVVPKINLTLEYYERVIDQVRDRLYNRRELAAKERYLYQYAIAHHNMHLESLTWLRQVLGYAAPSFVNVWHGGNDEEVVNEDVELAGGSYFIGFPVPEGDEQMAERFCFDNEKPGFELQLEPFQISKTLVSNAQFLEFIEDGGYENTELWSYGGKHWLRENGLRSPEYWEKRDGAWGVRRFDQWESLRTNAPVMHVSFREAEAFCKWAGRRLPNEFEWEVAAGREIGDVNLCDLGGRFGGTAPVRGLLGSARESGCVQMLGSAWEWTDNQYMPFQGFNPDMYAYMSTLQFGDHKTARGGSWASAQSLIRPTYRQAYLPDRRDVFVGFRTCAID